MSVFTRLLRKSQEKSDFAKKALGLSFIVSFRSSSRAFKASPPLVPFLGLLWKKTLICWHVIILRGLFYACSGRYFRLSPQFL